MIWQLRVLNRKLAERIQQLENERIPVRKILEGKTEFNQGRVAALWQSSLLGLGMGSVVLAFL